MKNSLPGGMKYTLRPIIIPTKSKKEKRVDQTVVEECRDKYGNTNSLLIRFIT